LTSPFPDTIVAPRASSSARAGAVGEALARQADHHLVRTLDVDVQQVVGRDRDGVPREVAQ